MRIAAGVILLLAAFFDLFAGITYFTGGGLAGAGGALMASEGKAGGGAAVAVGGGLMIFGVYLLATTGVLVATAVFLFQNSRRKFIFVGAAMAILAEIIGAALTSFGFTNLVGLAAGALGLFAAWQMRPVVSDTSA